MCIRDRSYRDLSDTEKKDVAENYLKLREELRAKFIERSENGGQEDAAETTESNNS